jgi:hypothetical protein
MPCRRLFARLAIGIQIMKTPHHPLAASITLLLSVGVTRLIPGEANPAKILTGRSAIVTSSGVNPGTFRKITFADLPKPFMTGSSTLRSQIAPRPAGALPQAPAGFRVQLFADGLRQPRVIRVAPNGDVFVAETQAGQVRAFRGVSPDGKARENSVFAAAFMSPTESSSIRPAKIRNGSTWPTPTRWSGTLTSPAT